MRAITNTITYRFPHPAEKVWEVVSDTPRWNEAAGGMPKYAVREELEGDGTVTIIASTTIAGYTIEWEELPVNWLAPRWFEQVRVFRNGPFTSLVAHVQLPAHAACKPRA